ncbi:hypothetical protein SAY87_026950 [Trapa incisa]|uniref:Uncharacterized protein n=1 Tax=Trapa incisa TaxID=236973 RepID=A0AAN7GMK5_9MYRT|nr:hypothetical protein SAY87_026950 [Trapa incisa]
MGEREILVSPKKTLTCGCGSDRTVVWMGNRDRPVNGKGSKLTFQRIYQLPRGLPSPDLTSQFKKFSYGELKTATGNFKEEVGRGGSGIVYKGNLRDGRRVAVKRLGDIHHGEDFFWAEVSTIGKINRMNLARRIYSRSLSMALEMVRGLRLSNWEVKGHGGDEEEVQEEAELTKFVKVIKRKIQSDSEEDTWIEEFLDPRLKGQFNRRQARALMEVGIACVEDDRNRRPTVDSVVHVLLECDDEAKVTADPLDEP